MQPKTQFAGKAASQRQRGFSLLEILTVIVIIVLLSALVLPVLAKARKAGKRTESVSNLHQCGVALLMYASDNSGLWPEMQPARDLLANAPTCDPADNWRKDCSEDFGNPLIGSYAYARGVKIFAFGGGELSRTTPLMISPFYAEPALPPFHLDDGPIRDDCPMRFCAMPAGLLTLRQDGSVFVRNSYPNVSGQSFGFSWSVAFTLDAVGTQVDP